MNADDLKKADEIVRVLRKAQEDYKNDIVSTGRIRIDAMARDCADLIESLQAQLSASQRREKAAMEEVCRRCSDGEIIDGLKHYPCDGCKWRGPKRLEVEL